MSRRILIVSGIWPPDVGGPASHGPAVGRYLTERGHGVEAFASVGSPPAGEPFPVSTTSRHAPLPLRWAHAEARLLSLVKHAAVVYATGLYHRTALACRRHGVPLVMKLANDPAYERARNSGFFDGSVEEFQESQGDARLRVLRAMRDRAVRQASRIVVPSRYLEAIVRAWNVTDRVDVVPNPAPPARPLPDRDVLRAERSLDGPTAVFVGRFVLQKNLPLLVESVRQTPDSLSVVLVGDGPERPAIAQLVQSHGLGDRVRLVDAVNRDEALRWMRAADATVLPSSWENYPHAAVESLTVGTPVIATSVGGVPEIVEHDVNGLLTDSGAVTQLAASLRAGVLDQATHARLRAGAEQVGDRFAPAAIFGRLEQLIVSEARS